MKRTVTHALLFFSAAALLAGCGDDDAVTPTPAPVVNARLISVGDETAVLAGLLASLPAALAEGRLAEVSRGAAVFDPACTCWRWSEIVDDQYDDPFQTWTRDRAYEVTYLAGGVPQGEWAGADAIRLAVDNALVLESYHDLSKSYYSSAWDYTVTVDVVPGDGVAVTGSGAGEMTGGYAAGSGSSWNGFLDALRWEIDFDQPAAGCPDGRLTLRLDTRPAAFTLNFDGGALPRWESSGLGNPAAGAFTLPCGNS